MFLVFLFILGCVCEPVTYVGTLRELISVNENFVCVGKRYFLDLGNNENVFITSTSGKVKLEYPSTQTSVVVEDILQLPNVGAIVRVNGTYGLSQDDADVLDVDHIWFLLRSSLKGPPGESPLIAGFLLNFSNEGNRKLCGTSQSPRRCSNYHTLENVRDVYYENKDSGNLKDMITQVSRGKTIPRIDQTTIFEVTVDRELKDLAKDLGGLIKEKINVNIDDYDNVGFIFPLNYYRYFLNDSTGAAFGQYPGKYSWYRTKLLQSVPHEYGHNIGFGHSGLLSSGRFLDYADGSSVMGIGISMRRGYNSAHLDIANWIPDDLKYEVDLRGPIQQQKAVEIQLESLYGRSDKPITIILTTRDDRVLYISYRIQEGYDYDLAGKHLDKILIREIYDEYRPTDTLLIASLDMGKHYNIGDEWRITHHNTPGKVLIGPSYIELENILCDGRSGAISRISSKINTIIDYCQNTETFLKHYRFRVPKSGYYKFSVKSKFQTDLVVTQNLAADKYRYRNVYYLHYNEYYHVKIISTDDAITDRSIEMNISETTGDNTLTVLMILVCIFGGVVLLCLILISALFYMNADILRKPSSNNYSEKEPYVRTTPKKDPSVTVTTVPPVNGNITNRNQPKSPSAKYDDLWITVEL